MRLVHVTLHKAGPGIGHHGRVPGIYDEPEFYQAACAYRDVPAEVDALLRWSGRFREPETGAPRSVLELAAGPAEHARELARRGLEATALDLSTAMCAQARELAKADGLSLTVIEADMRDFRLPGDVDLAVTMLNSLCHLMSLDDMLLHLASVARCLSPNGLYIMELAHPADFFAPVPRTSSEWTVDAPGVQAKVRWGGRGDRIDPLTQITREHMTITATAADGTIRTVSDVVPNRFWTLTEFTAGIALANGVPAGPDGGTFELVATYGDFDQTTPLDAPTAWRMVLVLRRS